MPQMSSLYWLVLMFFFCISYFGLVVVLYYSGVSFYFGSREATAYVNVLKF